MNHPTTSPDRVLAGLQWYIDNWPNKRLLAITCRDAIDLIQARQPQSPSTSLSDEVIQAGADELADIFTEEGRLTYPELAERIYRAMKSKEQSK